MIHVVAVIHAQPGQRDALLAAMHANLDAVRAEPGCIAYQPAIDAPDLGSLQAKYGQDAVVVLETWANLEALKAHGAAPHMIAFGRATKAIVAARAIHILTPA
jgi:quinol monooxygenase YgiN